MNVEEIQDNFWREALAMDPNNSKGMQVKYAQFMQNVQNEISHLSQTEQDEILKGLVSRNSEYMSIAKTDRNALRMKLGMPSVTPSSNHLAQVAAETAVRATVWQGIAALFRAFR